MAVLTLAAVSLLSLVSPSFSQQSPPGPELGQGDGTSFLDHETPISGFYGKTFLRENIPFIDIPDETIQDVYYYRWTSNQRHLRYVIAGTGYMSTEFMQPVGYAEAFGTIVAASGHQLDESKWLRSQFYAEDYIQIYNRGPANSTQYTEWISHVMNQRSLVTGDGDFLVSQLDDMVRGFREWDKVFDSSVGLYYYQPVWDAQELSLPGFLVDPDNQDWDLRKDGPDTYRPSHNAYMATNARAIVRAAQLAGNSGIENEFTSIADDIENAMYEHLWAPDQQFFMDVIRPDNPDLTALTGREEVGLYPYRFGIGLAKNYSQPAVDAMFDTDGFVTEYGPPTLEVRDPWYYPIKPDSYCCYWNGQSWPFSTAHAVSSLAAIYRQGSTNVTSEQVVQYLSTYAKTQYKNGQPYVAESHYPEQNAWSADTYNHSEHYAHSTYVNNVITDLFGILPKADDTLDIQPAVPENWTFFAIENLSYHGHLVTVLYDQDGSRYSQGSGLTVFVDGDNIFNSDYSPSSSTSKVITVDIPSPVLPSGQAPLVNIAANPTGPGQYPMAEATFTGPTDWPYKAIDGALFYDDIPDNRWTNYQSPNDNDTLTITFARPRNISSVTLALYSDADRGGAVDVPSRIEISGSGGLITVVDTSDSGSPQLLANDRNEIVFNSANSDVETTFLAVNLFNKSPSVFVGVCELEVWQPWTDPEYYAVDAYLTGGAQVVFGDSSDASTSAAVGGLSADSIIGFSGVKAAESSTVAAKLRYANNGTDTVAVDVMVNNNAATTTSVELVPTYGGGSESGYGEVEVQLKLAKGRNFVDVMGGTNAIKVERLISP